jgi:hypothetical protein
MTEYPNIAFEYLSEAILKVIPLLITQYFFFRVLLYYAWNSIFRFSFVRKWRPLLLSSLMKAGTNRSILNDMFPWRVYLKEGTS